MPARLPWILVSLGLAGCVITPGRGMPRRYALDSVSTTCARAPASCTTLTGKEAAPVVAATLATGTVAAVAVLTPGMKDRIQEALQRCAETARSEVLLRYTGSFKRPTPSDEECKEWTRDAHGQRVTWAMRLGNEMHTVAFECTRSRLNELRPGGFSIEPCYRYDPRTGKTTFISCAEVQALLDSGCGSDLKGTIKPDVVIHTGDPLKALDTYDFKFPCVNSSRRPQWREYPPDHPCGRLNQSDLYRDALGPVPVMLVPRIGAH